MPSKSANPAAANVDHVTRSFGNLGLHGKQTGSRASSEAGSLSSIKTQKLSTASVTNSVASSDWTSDDDAKSDRTTNIGNGGRHPRVASRFQKTPPLPKMYGNGNFSVAAWLNTVKERLRLAGIEYAWWTIAASSALRGNAWTWYQLARGRYQAAHGQDAMMGWTTFCQGLLKQFEETPVSTCFARLQQLQCSHGDVSRYVDQFCRILLRVPAGTYADVDLKAAMALRLPPKIHVVVQQSVKDKDVDFEEFIGKVRKINAAVM